MKIYKDVTGKVNYQCSECTIYYESKKLANPKNHNCNPEPQKWVQEFCEDKNNK